MPRVSSWVKGKSGTYFTMMFQQSMDFTPAVQMVQVTGEWQHYSFKLIQFNGTNGSDCMGFYVGGGRPG